MTAVQLPTTISATTKMLEGVRVLIVDDDQDALMVLERLLLRAGAIPTLARTADEALVRLESAAHDVIVSDISMPGGYHLVRRIRARPAGRGGRTPAIALTACVGDTDHARAILSGFQLHLGKPIKALELALSIRHVLDRVHPGGDVPQ